MKTCNKCNESKPRDEYGTDAGRKDGLRSTCKGCRRVARKYVVRTSEVRAAQAARTLKCLYGVTQEVYAGMLAAQGGGCAVCGATPEDNGKALAVDHDHSCCPRVSSGSRKTCGNCVRALLCDQCNRGIGLLGDNVDRLLAAAEYIERWTK